MTLITTGRLDAVFHEPPPERSRHTIGRPRLVGKRLPALEQVLQDPETVWQKLTLDCYGAGERTLQMCTGTAVWYRSGSDPLPLRWVLTRDPLGKRPRHPLSFAPTPVRRQRRLLKTRMKRCSLEVTFEEGRALMAHRDATAVVRPGYPALDTSALWPSSASSPALDKPGILMAAFLSRVSAWYRKQAATCSDVLAVVRRHGWGQATFPTSPTDLDVGKVASLYS